MPNLASYDIGDTVPVSFTFRSGGVAADPTSVEFRFVKPDNSQTTYVYGTDAQVVKEAVGRYRVDLVPDQSGFWSYRWRGTGAVTESDEGQFWVLMSAFGGTPVPAPPPGALDLHAIDTTNVHGIADTALLETVTGSQAKVDAHVTDATAAHASTAIGHGTGNVSEALSATVNKTGDQTITGAKSFSSIQVKENPTDIRHPDFGGVDPSGVADSGPAIRAALAFALAAGGRPVFAPGGTFAWAGDVDVPEKVDLLPAGLHATTFKALDATFRLRIGKTVLTTPGHRGGRTGGFLIDANNIAPNPFYVGLTVQRTLMDIEIRNAAAGGDAALIQAAQNCKVINFNIDNCAGNGLTVDAGASALSVDRYEFNDIGGYFIRFIQSVSPAGLPTDPGFNKFHDGICERPKASSPGLIYHGAGRDNGFLDGQLIGWPNPAASYPIGAPTYFPLVVMRADGGAVSTRLRFRDTKFQGTGTAGIVTAVDTEAGFHIIYMDNVFLQNIKRGFFLGDLTRVEVDRLESSPGMTLFESRTGTKKANDLLVNRVLGAQPLKVPAAAFTSSQTLGETQHTALVSAAGAARVITLPQMTADLAGRQFTIKKTDSSANAVTVTPNGGTIDGAATYVLVAQYKYVTLVADGTNWHVVGNN